MSLSPSASDPYLHLPHDPTATGFYLCAPAYAKLDIRLIKQNGYPSNLYRFLIVTLLTRPLPHKGLSGRCEGNLNHPLLMLSVTAILEVSNYCMTLIVLVGRSEIGRRSCSPPLYWLQIGCGFLLITEAPHKNWLVTIMCKVWGGGG